MVFLMVGYYVWEPLTEINDAIQNDDEMSDIAKTRSQYTEDKFSGFIEGSAIVIFFGLWFGALVAGYFIDAHPILFVLIAILLILSFWVIAEVGNGFSDVTDSTAIQELREKTPVSAFISNHWLEFAIVMGFSICVAIFGRFIL
jgi:hypothetical protein